MRLSPRVRNWLCFIVYAGCGGFLIWSASQRLARIDHMMGVAQWSVSPSTIDPHSPTGYAYGRRLWLSPGRSEEAFPWILDAQELLDGRDWRARRVDYDNAPEGRDHHGPLLYRLWLGVVAGIDVLLCGSSRPLAAERAAGWADPLLSALFLLAAGIGIARTFGRASACLFAFGWVGLFPLATTYFPGTPDPRSLGWMALAASVLVILGAQRSSTVGGARRGFFLAGLVGGIALSLDLVCTLVALTGVGLGAIVAAYIRHGNRHSSDEPVEGTVAEDAWRLWSFGGALSSLGLIALETLPDSPALPRPGVLHPLHAIAWLGWGELIKLSIGWIRRPEPRRVYTRDWACLAMALAALGALPAVIMTISPELPDGPDLLAERLSPITDIVAPTWSKAFAQEGAARPMVAALLPWSAVLMLGGFLVSRIRRGVHPAASAVALGAGLALVFLSLTQLRALAPAGALLLVVIVAWLADDDRVADNALVWPWLPALGLSSAILPGLLLLWPPTGREGLTALDRGDVEAIVERDLAFWLSQQAEGNPAIVLSSPSVSTALAFHGGLRGVASLHRENAAGLRAALRIARASSPDEALALIRQREIRYLVLPTWDPFLDRAARVGTPAGASSFMDALRRWVPLPWLRPLVYRLPKIGGFEDEHVVVFEVVDEQTEARTLVLQADYFIEMGWLDLAAGLRRELSRFPADLGAIIAIARIEAARGDQPALDTILTSLLSVLSGGADRTLAWDRRVNLALLLAQMQRPDLAETHVRRTLKEATAARIQSLSAPTLFRWLALVQRIGSELPDAKLQSLALRRLPPDLAARLHR